MSQVQWKDGIPVFSGPPPPVVQRMLNKVKEKEEQSNEESSGLSNEVAPNDEAGSCTYCKKRFDNFAQFLRHVSHSKLCLDAHDPFVIEKIKRKSRLRSKAKWNLKNKNRLKEERKRKRSDTTDQQSKSSSYITVGEKKSFRGKMFYKVFDATYDLQVQLAETRIEELSKRRKLSHGLKMELMDDALEYAFKSTDIVFEELSVDSEEKTLVDVFELLELKFKNKFDEECSEQIKLWTENRLYDVTDGLFSSTLDGAYRNFFRTNEFNSLLQTIESSALDKLFLDIIQTDSFTYDDKAPHKFEDMLESRFVKECKEEAKNHLNETGLQSNLQSYLIKAFTKRFLKEGLKLKD